MWTVMHPPPQSTSSHCIRDWHSLVCWCLPSMGPVYQPHPIKPTPRGSGSEMTPWVASGLVTTQHQSSQTSLGWINGKLWLLLWTYTRASTEDEWRLQVMCSWSGVLQDHMHLAEGVDISSPLMPLYSRLNNCHNYSWNWATVARP